MAVQVGYVPTAEQVAAQQARKSSTSSRESST